MHPTTRFTSSVRPCRLWTVVLAATASAAAAASAQADVVTQWSVHDGQFITAAAMGTPPANRLMAIAHTAAYEAANAITRRYPGDRASIEAPSAASVDAAIAAAHRQVMLQALPAQKAAIEAAYQATLDTIDDIAMRDAGVAVGERAAASVLAARAGDGAAQAEAYRPHAMPGRYVPTVVPVATQWPQRRPWMLASASQLRPAAPPALDSATWARDFNEVKAMGGRASTRRTPQQTDMARFWEATLPPIYHGLVRGLAEQPGRDVLRNARLFAAITQATDDALIAVMEAKYHYGFWRPITAIRNGAFDDNPDTEPDAAWLPLIDTPMHPEYPCAHCIQAAAVATLLQAELGDRPAPAWSTTSSAVQDASRSWPTLDAFVQEVSEARILDGVHFRRSTEAGTAMGRRLGAIAAARWFPGP